MKWIRRLFSTSGPAVRFPGKRVTHLPTRRALATLGTDSVTIDLATSQVSGLIIHEPEENVRQVLGVPDVTAHSHVLLYSAHGLGVVLIAGKVHAFHFWLSPEDADYVLGGPQPFEQGQPHSDPKECVAQFARGFVPCSARIVGRGEGSLRLGRDVTSTEIEAKLGQPDKSREDTNSLTYFGRVPAGHYDRLHLDLNISEGRFRSGYVTH